MRAKIIDALLLFLFYWVFYLVTLSLIMTFVVVFVVPLFVFFRTGLIKLMPELDLFYKTMKFVLFSATSVSIILWVSSFVFPEDTKTKKYWWNKEINKKD